jgi:hypothetical protein
MPGRESNLKPPIIRLAFRCAFYLLKVVGNEKEGGREAGYCLKMVSDRGDRCLFTF